MNGSQQIIADVIDNQFYEADCYIRGTNLVAKYNYINGEKSEYTYYTQNAHGDVVNLTNADGEVTKSYKYDAFGVEINLDTNDVNVFRFCGEYFDTETGTVYLRARYYQASIGRFISRDSFAGRKSDPLSLNLYTYCHNNPIIYFDPSGHGIISNAFNNAKNLLQNKISSTQKATSNANSASSLVNSKKLEIDNKNSTSSQNYSRCGNIAVSESELEQFGWYNVTAETVKGLNQTLDKYKIITKDEISHFLAQCAYESRFGEWKTEACYMSEEDRLDYLTSQTYYPYYGAGYIQLTHDYNYKDFSEAMGDSNIMDGPQYVADNYAWQAAGWFWDNNNINEEIRNGANVERVTEIVHGDSDSYTEREEYYYKALSILE